MPKEHQIHVLLAFAKQTGKRNELGLLVAPQINSKVGEQTPKILIWVWRIAHLARDGT